MGDFGVCTVWKQSSAWDERAQVVPTDGHCAGTHRYLSVNSHHKVGAQPSDDLEQLMWTIVEIMLQATGAKLPWQGQGSTEPREIALKKTEFLANPDQFLGEIPDWASHHLKQLID